MRHGPTGRTTRRGAATALRAVLAAAVAAAALAASPAPAAAHPGDHQHPHPHPQPWRLAAAIDSDFSDVRGDLILGERPSHGLEGSRGLLAGRVESELARHAPADLEALRRALDRGARALASGDQVALAAAEGAAVAALRAGAYRTALALTEAGRPARASAWLQVRAFRPTTRYTRPTAEATEALGELADGDATPHEAAMAVEKDLLDTYQAQIRIGLDEASTAASRGFDTRLAELTALSAGYWTIIRDRYREDRGAEEARRVSALFARVAAAGLGDDAEAFSLAERRITDALDGFVAAPLTLDDKVRRANQFDRFLDLIPVEYDRGVSDGHLNLAFEVQEAVAFADGADQAFADLAPDLLDADPAATRAVERDLAALEADLGRTIDRVTVVPNDRVHELHDRIADATDRLFPEEWKESSDDADYDLVDISLTQMMTAVNAGAWQQAEQNRLSAYAFFEFGPEIKLNAFDPGLSTEIEGLFWYGARDVKGLASLISARAQTTEVQETLVELDAAIGEAHEKTDAGASDGTVVTNAALIVFREGLEAILIIAAITASMIGARRRLRKPIYRGALLAIPASVVAYAAAVLLLGSFARYGEKVEAVVGLMAIAVLLIVLNWFFHRVYWTEWIAGHRRKSKELTGAVVGGAVAGTATVAGLYLLGFEAVFREGMETVLFLQALQLTAGTGVVLIGVLLGAVGIAIIGTLTFVLESKLPYKKMLIVTGVLIAFVLFTMVGGTVRTLQGVGWFPIHPIDVDVPLWMGTWLGIFPTWETIGFQVLAVAFVIGSYWLAGWVSKRKLRREREAWAAHNPPEAGKPSDKDRVPISSAGPK